jgi:hypothetical protein
VKRAAFVGLTGRFHPVAVSCRPLSRFAVRVCGRDRFWSPACTCSCSYATNVGMWMVEVTCRYDLFALGRHFIISWMHSCFHRNLAGRPLLEVNRVENILWTRSSTSMPPKPPLLSLIFAGIRTMESPTGSSLPASELLAPCSSRLAFSSPPPTAAPCHPLSTHRRIKPLKLFNNLSSPRNAPSSPLCNPPFAHGPQSRSTSSRSTSSRTRPSSSRRSRRRWV